MDILVTGGAGFIGSNYVHHVLETTELSVTTIDNLTYAGSRDKLPERSSRHRFVEGSIAEDALVSDLVSDADFVVNFAAESHVDNAIDDSSRFVDTNVGGLQTLLEAAKETDLDAFVQMSTDEVYGEIVDGAFTEDSPLNPRNPYAATKAGGDLLALSYYETHEVPVKIARPSNTFGPRQHPEKLIPKLITRAVAGEPLPIYGNGTNVREWTYVEDTCRAVDIVRQDGKSGTAYNAGSGEELENIEVAGRVVDAVDSDPDLITFVEDRPGHDQRYSLDSSRIRSLGWRPHWSFDEGLEAAIEYYTD